MIGVYKIRNAVDGKFYIGSSVNIEKRFKSHKSALLRGIHNNKYLQNAWNRYGENSFEFSVVELTDKESLRDRESYYLKCTNCTNPSIGYNLLNDANIGFGVSASPEIKHKISLACAGAKNGNYGRKHTLDELQRIRDNRWGKDYICKSRTSAPKISEEAKLLLNQKRAEFMRNRVVSQETREKLRQYRLGKRASAELRQKLSMSRRGEHNANCKLSKEQVLEIYEKMHNGVHYKDICKQYNIGQCQAYKIKRKEHWVFNDSE